ncbi:MAG: hypothetical protein C0511_18090 [Hyphomicrobium sp.]|nr:hypothetical protein [Hyphomicrobium sp.]
MRTTSKSPEGSLGSATDLKHAQDVAALSAELDSQVGRFNLPARREIRRLVRSSSRLADLATVFPGAIYAIASRRGPAANRLQAISLVEQGAPLKAVAKSLDLPLWLKRLPPEAFRGPLGRLPAGEVFTRRVANRIPRTMAETACWLDTMTFATESCHDDFALWLADQHLYTEPSEPERLFAVLAAYAWFSGTPATRAHQLIVVPWRAEIGFDTAVCAAKSWLNRLRLVMQLDQGVITDPWLEGGKAMGLEFVALIDQREILEESQSMQNCADQYAERLSRDKCRLFSVRRSGTRIATLEIGPHPRETGVLTITQLKARHNMPVPGDVWQAAHAWLSCQTGLKRIPPMMAPDRPLKVETWEALMAPYRQKTNGAHWLPESATLSAFGQLDHDLADLARRAGVSSWLFT